jgi:hypothetical protein
MLILWHESAYTEPYLLLAGYQIWAQNAINQERSLGRVGLAPPNFPQGWRGQVG